MSTKLTPRRLNEMLERFAAGEPAARLAREYGIGRSTISHHAKRRGLSSGWTPKIDKELLGEKLRSGLWPKAIAADFGVSETAVHRAIGRHYPEFKRPRIDMEALERLARHGFRPPAIANVLGVKRDAVYKAIGRLKDRGGRIAA